MAKIAVIGGGRMGSGIAHAYLLAGNEVFLDEANNDASIAARDRIKKLIQRFQRISLHYISCG